MYFIKKTSSRRNIIGLFMKLAFAIVLISIIILLLNEIEFPKPEKEIEKIIPNEKFKIVK